MLILRAFWVLLSGWLRHSRSGVVSFDLYDTLIYRKCGTPYNALMLVEHHLGIPGLAAMRRDTERYCRNSAQGDVPFKYIYATMEKRYPGFDWEHVAKVEQAIERENLRLSEKTFWKLRRHRAAGRKIVYISDMYYSTEWLKAELTRLGVWREGDVMIVSCDLGACKRDGSLFAESKKLLGLATWTHYGDNIKSDILRAHENGLLAKWAPHSYLYVLKASLSKRLFRDR